MPGRAAGESDLNFDTWANTTAQDVEVQPKLLSSEPWCGLESNSELIGPVIFEQRCICTTYAPHHGRRRVLEEGTLASSTAIGYPVRMTIPHEVLQK
jgi:hypothetical protein